jgi:hypothetical protein
MKRFPLSISGLLLTASFAQACDCPLVKDPKDPMAQSKIEEKRRATAVKLKVLDFSMRRSDDSDPFGQSSAVVVRQPQSGERHPQQIVVFSDGGDEGANCGAASLLFEAVSTGRDITVNLSRTEDGRYIPDACGLREIDPWP